MHSHEVILTLRPNGLPVVIPTPMGLISINRLSTSEVERFKKRGEDARKVKITLPEGLRAFVGEEDALEGTQYIERRNGKIVPRFQMLVPQVREGELVGLMVPTVLNLGDKT